MKVLKNVRLESSIFSNPAVFERGFSQPLSKYVRNIAQNVVSQNDVTSLTNATITTSTLSNCSLSGGTITNATIVSNLQPPVANPMTIQNGILSNAFITTPVLLSPTIYTSVNETPVFETFNGEVQISKCNLKGGNYTVAVNDPAALNDYAIQNFDVFGCAIRETSSIDSRCGLGIGIALYPLFKTFHYSTHGVNVTPFPRESVSIVDSGTVTVYRFFGATGFDDGTRRSVALPIPVANLVCKQIGNLVWLHLYIRFDEYATNTADMNNFRMYLNNSFFPGLPQPDTNIVLGVDSDGTNPNYNEYVEIYSMTTRIRYGGSTDSSTVSGDGSYGTSVSAASTNISNYPLSINASGIPPSTTINNWVGPNLAFRVTTDYFNVITIAIQGFYFTS